MSNRRSLNSEERISSTLIKNSSHERLHLEQLSITQLSNLIERLNLDLTDLQYALDIKDKILIDQQFQYDSLLEENQALVEKNRTLEKMIEKNNDSIHEMQQKLEQYVSSLEICENQITSKDALIGLTQTKNCLLETQVKDLTKIIQTPDEDLSPYDKVQVCEIKNKVFSRNYDPLLELQATKDMYIEDIQALSFNNAFLKDKIASLQGNIYKLEDQVASYKIQANDLSSEISNLNEKLDSVQSEFSSEVQKLTEEICSKDSELDKNQDLVNEYIKNLARKKDKIKRLQLAYQDLEKNNLELSELLNLHKENHLSITEIDKSPPKAEASKNQDKSNRQGDNAKANEKTVPQNQVIRIAAQILTNKNSYKNSFNLELLNTLREKVMHVYRELFCKINIASRDHFQISGSQLADIECNFNKLVEFITESMEEKLDSLETSACSKQIYT